SPRSGRAATRGGARSAAVARTTSRRCRRRAATPSCDRRPAPGGPRSRAIRPEATGGASPPTRSRSGSPPSTGPGVDRGQVGAQERDELVGGEPQEAGLLGADLVVVDPGEPGGDEAPDRGGYGLRVGTA